MHQKQYLEKYNYLLRSGDVNKAYLLIKEARIKFPDTYLIKERYNYTIYRMGDISKSISLYYKLIRNYPNLSNGYNGLIQVLLQQFRVNEAEELLLKATKLFPTNQAIVERNIQFYLMTNAYEKAYILAKKSLKDNPNHPKRYLKMCQILLFQNKLEETKSVLGKALKIFPQNLKLNERMAHLNVLNGNIEQAIDLYKKIILNHPNSILGYTGLGHTLLRQNKLNEAEDMFELINMKFPVQRTNPKFAHLKSLASKDMFPTIASKSDDIIRLIEELHPIICDKPLIRIGTKYGDGGYLLLDDLENIEACFSPGVGPEARFEKECANLGMNVFLADKSVVKPRLSHKSFDFKNKFIGVYNDLGTITLKNWVLSSLPYSINSDLLLQMDIEGDEFSVLLSTPQEILNRFRIIIIEFHWLENLWSLPFFTIFRSVIKKILNTHSCVHIHPNNNIEIFKWQGVEIPSVIEVTFHRNDRIENLGFRKAFPHPLDFRNNPFLKDIALPKQWYSQK